MRTKNKLLNTTLAMILTFGGLGFFYSPVSATSSTLPKTADVSPAAINTCNPGYQEGFDTVNNKWFNLSGNLDDVGITNSQLFLQLDAGGSDPSAAISADSFSGDFEAEVEIKSLSGYNSATDALFVWMTGYAADTDDDYFAMSLNGDDYIQSYFLTSPGTQTFGDTVELNGSLTLPLSLKMVRSGSTVYTYYKMDGHYNLAASLSGITTDAVYITLNATTGVNTHPIDVRLDSFRHGCALPSFSDFEMNGGLTSTPVSSIIFNNRMYQFIGGWSSPNKIYMRSTADGIFDGSDAGEAWVHDTGSGGPGGETATEIGVAKMGETDDYLYISVKGRDTGQIFTKRMNDAGVWDSTWTENGGKSGAAIAMTSAYVSVEERLYQVIRGFSSNNLYYRYTADGTFDSSVANEDWSPVMNQTNVATSPNAPAIEVYNSRIYISVRGSSGNINYASTVDGTFDSDASDEYFILSGGKTSTTPTLENFGGYLLQSTKGNSTDLIYTRYFNDEDGWSEWFEYGGKTPSRVDLTKFGSTLFQTARGNSGNIFMRIAEGYLP